jgi:SAM-dependent methyltransferase
MKTNSHIITDQELFFNQNALQQRIIDQENMFMKYAQKEQVKGFDWLSNKKNILDFGCGTGNSIDLFFYKRKIKGYKLYGVDIAQEAIKYVSKKYPDFKFFKISNNKIPQIMANGVDASYLLNVLHHARSHQEIFKEIYKKLDRNGKFFICDLCSNNPINKSARNIFVRMPKFVRDKFSDDLVVGEAIPEKYKVNVDDVVKQLKKVGFKIEEVSYGHLFFFVFGWIDRFIPLSKINFIQSTYQQLMKFEQWLLTFKIFQSRAEVFCIKCIKK